MNIIQRISNLWRPREISQGQLFYPVEMGKGQRSFDYLEAFSCIPEVNATVNLKARCFSNGKVKIVDRNGKEIPHRYTALLREPNWFQPIAELMRQSKIFHDVYGNEFLFLLKPIGMDTVKALFTLPPNLVECEFIGPQPFFLYDEIPQVKYTIDVGNSRRMPLAHEDVIHMNDNRVTVNSATDKCLLLGESKLKALSQAISNLYDAYQSRGIILRHRGAIGILSGDNKDALGSNVPMDEAEIKDLQEKYRQMYGLSSSGQFQMIISSLGLKWQPIEVDPRKLGLFDETREDFAKILDSFGIPMEMFVTVEGSTYENQNQARKGLYENAVIPEANEWIGAINSTLFEDDNAKAIVDYSHLPIFQEDLKVTTDIMNTRVTYLSRLYADQAITLEEYRSELAKVGIVKGKAPAAGKSVDLNSRVNGHVALLTQ